MPLNIRTTPTERDTVLKQLHEWFENYCEGNEDPDLWMAFLHAERALRTPPHPNHPSAHKIRRQP